MVYVGDLPVILKSRICLHSKLSSDDLIGVGEDPLDPGGYFIVNGSERVIAPLEDLAANRILVDIEHTGVNPTYKAKIFSTTVGFRARIEVTLKADGGTYVTMPGIPSDIPFMIVMRALGFEEDAKVAELVSLDPTIQNELEGSFENLTRDLKYQLERITIRRHIEFSIANAIRPGIITERVQHAIATGNWVRGRIGVTQLLDRTNFISTLSHLRRLQSPLSRSQPNLEARDLHPTHYGRLCPDETPEGSNCGLVKNLALSSSISVGIDPHEMVEKLRRMGVIPVEESDKKLRATGGKVVVDGIIAGYSKDPMALAEELREYRRQGKISSEVNFGFHPPEVETGRKELYINCDPGRVRRPLIVAEGGRPKR